MSEERRGENQDLFAVTSMIPYYDSLTGEEKREVTDSIRLLLRQTFLLERKYDRRTERFQNNRDTRSCESLWSLSGNSGPLRGLRCRRTASWV